MTERQNQKKKKKKRFLCTLWAIKVCVFLGLDEEGEYKSWKASGMAKLKTRRSMVWKSMFTSVSVLILGMAGELDNFSSNRSSKREVKNKCALA